jgi:hypothetical protein
MKVLVCGSRDWKDHQLISNVLAQLPRGTVVIHGAARGADTIAAAIADAMGFETRAFPADWRGKGRRAGILRNLAMLNDRPDRVIAFQLHGSTGTQHTIDEARKRGTPVDVYGPRGTVS